VRLGAAMVGVVTLLVGPLVGGPAGAAEGRDGVAPESVAVVGDAIPLSLTGRQADAARGRDVAFARDRGNCPVCHVMPAPDEKLHGDVGPSLAGVAGRLTEGQMRLRLVDGRRLNAASLMPAYYRLDGLKRVAANYAGKTALTAEEIEDVLAYLMTLRPEEKK
jgi:L-cysteine S-thiosulfotransferase